MAKSSSGTGENDPVADLGVRVLDGTVDGDTLRIPRQTLFALAQADQLTAQRMEAASAEERPSGMGET